MFYNEEEFFETSYKNYYVSKSGKLLSSTRLGVIVKDKFFIDPHGYARPAIMVEKGKQRRVFMHSIMMRTFVGECPKGFCVDHIDKNKLNNNINNLRYLSVKENLSRSHKGVAPKKAMICFLTLDGITKKFSSITLMHKSLGLNRHQYCRIKAQAKRVKQYKVISWKDTGGAVYIELETIPMCLTANPDECKGVGGKQMTPETVDPE